MLRKWIILAAAILASPTYTLAQVQSGLQSGAPQSGVQSGLQSGAPQSGLQSGAPQSGFQNGVQSGGQSGVLGNAGGFTGGSQSSGTPPAGNTR
jgi:hypothetical protein